MRVESHPAKEDALIDLIVKTRSKLWIFRKKHALEMWPDRGEQNNKEIVEKAQGGFQTFIIVNEKANLICVAVTELAP